MRGATTRTGTAITVVVLAAFLLSASGCHSEAAAPGGAPPSAIATATDVIDFHGLPGLAIGTSLDELSTNGAVTTAGPGCGPAFASRSDASPAFDGGRLVLIWAYPPLRTPENVGVGTSVKAARTAYPAAVDLPAPAGTNLYPGLLINGPDGLAYLLLYDAGAVQKLVVGERSYAELLVGNGFGSC